MRLAEFLSVQLGAEESLESPPDLSKVSRLRFLVRQSWSPRPCALLSLLCPDSHLLYSLVMFPHC